MRSGSNCGLAARRQHGFGYLLVLFALATMGLSLAGAGQVWQAVAQRDKEAELLFIGNQFRLAIGSYHATTPDAVRQYPASLEELLEDKRLPVPRRHLRQIYRDPMTGSTEWGLVKVGNRIVGVHSLSDKKAFKTEFLGRDAALVGTTHYEQWVFVPTESGVTP